MQSERGPGYSVSNCDTGRKEISITCEPIGLGHEVHFAEGPLASTGLMQGHPDLDAAILIFLCKRGEPFGLMHVFDVQGARDFGASLLRLADQMEAQADNIATAALDRAGDRLRKGGAS